MASTQLMPIGSPMTEIRENQVEVTPGDVAPPKFHDDAAATLVWENFQKAKNYLEQNSWLLEWQETDVLYQSPTPNRGVKVEAGRPARISRFLVAKNTRTMARAIKRGLFADQTPFFLRPTGKTTTDQVDAWTALLKKLLKRAKFQYHCGLLINCQTLQGTGIARGGVEERKVIKKVRVRKQPAETVPLPDGTTKELPTEESDAFSIEKKEVTETWPFFEYRRLGTTLFDPKWCTPDDPDESAGYALDIEYVNFADLQRMRQLDCYKNIPDEATLKDFFFRNAEISAPAGSQVADTMTSQGSMVTHAEGPERATDTDPLKKVLLMIEQWDDRSTKAILEYDGRKLCIRNEDHDWGKSLHFTATWWPIDNSGYGIGLGRLGGPDQRINQGVTNECLKMIAYPFNAPILTARGDNAPTQNVIQRLGGFWQVDVPPGGDVTKAVAFMKMPDVPAEAWKMLDISQHGGEDLVGANSTMQQGNLGGPGSSAARTAAGANRIASQSDQNVADPIDSVAYGVIVPYIEFLIDYVKTKMPLREIRDILSTKHAAIIEGAIAADQFIAAEFEVDVLAGAKLAARAGIQQLIPFLLQIVQQPQLLEFLHQRGETVDFKVMMDLMLQVSELANQEDIFRPLTKQELETMQKMAPGAQKIQATQVQEQSKQQGKIAQIAAKGETDRANTAAKIVMEHAADGIPLERAAGLVERGEDVDALKNGLPDMTQ